jgi:hypothetical protein
LEHRHQVPRYLVESRAVPDGRRGDAMNVSELKVPSSRVSLGGTDESSVH